MSKYTTELRYICESLAGLTDSVGFHDTFDGQGSVYNLSKNKIWDFDYSDYIPELADREILQFLFLSHYYDQEIAYETFGLWHLHFREQWLAKIPKLALELKADKEMLNYLPSRDVSHVTKTKGKNKNSGSDVTESNAKNYGWNDIAKSDTPQGKLSGVENLDYLSEYTKNRNDNKNENKSTMTHGLVTENDSKTEYHGSANISDSIIKYRNTAQNTMLKFVKSFENLFMQIY